MSWNEKNGKWNTAKKIHTSIHPSIPFHDRTHWKDVRSQITQEHYIRCTYCDRYHTDIPSDPQHININLNYPSVDTTLDGSALKLAQSWVCVTQKKAIRLLELWSIYKTRLHLIIWIAATNIKKKKLTKWIVMTLNVLTKALWTTIPPKTLKENVLIFTQ